jgi:hypothetical protein
VGLWQILARQRQIPNGQLNECWREVVRPFSAIQSSAQLYDAGRTSLQQLLRAASGKRAASQEELVDLLAGPPQTLPEGKRMHQEFARRILSILDSLLRWATPCRRKPRESRRAMP